MRISIIVAASENNIIGRDNSIPWHLPDDLKFFRKKTEGHPVIMGRKNFESIVAALGKPLPNRNNIIVTRESTYEAAGCQTASSLEEAIMYGHQDNDKEEIFVIGGGEIYKQAMDLCNYMYLTRIHAWIAGDITFPEVDSEVWEEVEREEHKADTKHKFGFTFLTYKRKSRLHFEDQ
ncbi:MAG: dihydrofolate reductase [Candidatus Peribacteraceae bacterium]|jgi:dihydrofolate reductase|nr:dihydrofolate reductase [Candidatus Peribacteraceae bacterium]